jgi:membrane-associated phospholipid phosphatase
LAEKFVLGILLIAFYLPARCSPRPDDEQKADSSGSLQTWKYIGMGGGAVISTFIMFGYDQQIYDGLYGLKQRNKFVKELSPVITYLGDGIFSLGLFGGFFGYGTIFRDKKAVEVGKIGFESFLLTGITVQLLKNLAGRERPSVSTRRGGFWHGPFAFIRQPTGVSKGISFFDAFPSGHTATVFSAATTLSDFYPQPWVSYTSYSLATLCALSRIMESTHWLSDCFVGAIIGYYGTKLVERINYGGEDISVIPWADQERCGLLFCINF